MKNIILKIFSLANVKKKVSPFPTNTRVEAAWGCGGDCC